MAETYNFEPLKHCQLSELGKRVFKHFVGMAIYEACLPTTEMKVMTNQKKEKVCWNNFVDIVNHADIPNYCLMYLMADVPDEKEILSIKNLAVLLTSRARVSTSHQF